MRFVVMVRANKQTESAAMPSREELAQMGKFNDGLEKDGVLLAADGLQPSSKGARLRFDAGRTTVIDGPFAETKELIAGFWIVQGKSKAEIVERFIHAPFEPGWELEIRQFFEADDFDQDLAQEMRAQAERLEAAKRG